MKYLVCIHGGTTFKKKKDYIDFLKYRSINLHKVSWTGKYLDSKLGKIFTIIRPRMPCQDNAKYKEWKLHFQNLLLQISKDKELILIGNSLGGIFLTKYLSEETLSNIIHHTFIIAAPYDNSLDSEDLAGGFILKKDLSKIWQNTTKLTFIFSANDSVVDLKHRDKYMQKLPNAEFITLNKQYGHFAIEKFPEIISLLKKTI